MKKNKRNLIFIVLAGEAIFMLPFMIPRLYRPLLLEAWHLTNRDLGRAFAAYGFMAMFSYLLGGPLADRFHPRILISASLFITAVASFYLVTFPSPISLITTYTFFGFSTIFFMWGALIKTTHIYGGEHQRSLAMGLLDGGRGLTAAVFGSILILLLSFLNVDLQASHQQIFALKIIYFITAFFTLLIGIAIWFTLSDFKNYKAYQTHWNKKKLILAFKNSNVWLLSAVILGSYCGYKGIDNYSLYWIEVHNSDLKESSLLTSILFWLRPVSALITGAIADKFHKINDSGRFLVLLALLTVAGILQLVLAFTGGSGLLWAFTLIVISAAFVYGLRAIYFSVFGDLHVPEFLVGTTTGIVSFVGFMPDIFFGLVTGTFIDLFPGAQGFSYAFLFTAVCVLIGAGASFVLYQRHRHSQNT